MKQVRILLLLLSCYSLPIWATPATCQSSVYDGRARVAKVYDGDSLRFESRQKVRIIGINTPELDHEQGRHEPYALAARDALQGWLGDDAYLHYRIGRQSKDRYGRQLLHLFLPDGRNLAELLLEQGMAWRIAIPPNLGFQLCYQQAEQRARRAGLGIWQQPPLSAKELERGARGFRLIRGEVLAIKESRKSYWLQMPGHLALEVKKTDSEAFRGLDLTSLAGQEIEVRGWLRYHKKGRYAGQSSMRLTHASAIRIVEQDN